jgi:hypothetical protein
MKKRNPGTPHRYVGGNAEKTRARKEQYYGIEALLQTWESRPMAMQCRNHAYILSLRARVRKVRNCLEHRAGPDADIS